MIATAVPPTGSVAGSRVVLIADGSGGQRVLVGEAVGEEHVPVLLARQHDRVGRSGKQRTGAVQVVLADAGDRVERRRFLTERNAELHQLFRPGRLLASVEVGDVDERRRVAEHRMEADAELVVEVQRAAGLAEERERGHRLHRQDARAVVGEPVGVVGHLLGIGPGNRLRRSRIVGPVMRMNVADETRSTRANAAWPSCRCRARRRTRRSAGRRASESLNVWQVAACRLSRRSQAICRRPSKPTCRTTRPRSSSSGAEPRHSGRWRDSPGPRCSRRESAS